MQETQVRFLGQEDPLEKGMATHSSILLGESHGQRSLVGYSPWGCKESEVTEQLTLHFHPTYHSAHSPANKVQDSSISKSIKPNFPQSSSTNMNGPDTVERTGM